MNKLETESKIKKRISEINLLMRYFFAVRHLS